MNGQIAGTSSVPGDGDCLFHSVIKALLEHQWELVDIIARMTNLFKREKHLKRFNLLTPKGMRALVIFALHRNKRLAKLHLDRFRKLQIWLYEGLSDIVEPGYHSLSEVDLYNMTEVAKWIRDPSKYWGDELSLDVLNYYFKFNLALVTPDGCNLNFRSGGRKTLFVNLTHQHYTPIFFRTTLMEESYFVDSDEAEAVSALFG